MVLCYTVSRIKQEENIIRLLACARRCKEWILSKDNVCGAVKWADAAAE